MATNSTMEITPVPGAIVEREGPRDAAVVTPPAVAAQFQDRAGAQADDAAADLQNAGTEARATTPALGPNNERLDDLKPRVVAALRDLMLQFRSEGIVARRHEIRRIKQARLFWQGLQYAWWNPADMSWHLPFESQMSDDKSLEEMPRYQFVTNLYQAFGLSFIALVSQDTPATRFYPQSAQSDIDVLTARAASDVAALVEENNKVQQLLTGVGYYLWTDGKIGGYVRYVSDAQRFGWHNEDIVEEALVRLGEDAYVCPQCGHETPADGTSDVTCVGAQHVAPLQSQETRDANENATAGAQANRSAAAQQSASFLAGAICPQCGAQLSHHDFRRAPVVAIPRVTGVRRVPNGQEVISILGGLELNTPVWANEMHEFPYLQWQQEVHIAKLRAAYPDAADKIILGGPVEAEDVYARASRVAVAQGLPTTQPGDALYNLITFTRTWIRPWAFYALEDKQTRDELLALFPGGCYVAFAGETYCEARNETLDDHWRVMHALPGDGQNRPSVGDSLVQIQERYNTLSNIQAETYEFGIPPIYADPQVLDFDALSSQTAEPAAHYPARAKPGQPLAASFFQPAPAQVPADMLEHQQELAGPVAQFLTGLFPAVFGGTQGGAGKTASGYAMARDQAMGRLGLVWRRLKQFYADLMLLGVDTFRQNRPQDVEIPLLGASGEFESKWIRLADLKGNIQVHPEADETFPRMKSQQRAVLQSLLASNDPMIAQALSDPDNIGFIKGVFGLDELAVPGEDAREKQLREISQLLASAPIVVPAPSVAPMSQAVPANSVAPPPAASVDVPADGATSANGAIVGAQSPSLGTAPLQNAGAETGPTTPAQHFIELPSVPIDELLDDHAAELAEVRRWASSDAGQLARAQNPLGFANVRAHAAAHHAALARQTAQTAIQQAAVSAVEKTRA